MQIQGTKTLSGRPELLWDILMDPEVLGRTVPGCRSIRRIDDDAFEGVIEAQIGPMKGSFAAHFTVTEKDYPNSYRLNFHGSGHGSTIDGSAKIELESLNNEATAMRYVSDASVGGLAAMIGRRHIESVAEGLLERGFDDLAAAVEERVRGDG